MIKFGISTLLVFSGVLDAVPLTLGCNLGFFEARLIEGIQCDMSMQANELGSFGLELAFWNAKPKTEYSYFNGQIITLKYAKKGNHLARIYWSERLIGDEFQGLNIRLGGGLIEEAENSITDYYYFLSTGVQFTQTLNSHFSYRYTFDPMFVYYNTSSLLPFYSIDISVGVSYKL